MNLRRPLLFLAAVAILPACDEKAGDTFITSPIRTARPFLTGSTPASPAQNAAPILQGSAEANAQVRIFTNPSGAGAPAATTTADAAGAFSAGVAAASNASTTFYAFATGTTGVESEASEGFVYVHDTSNPNPPVLTGTSPPTPNYESRPFVLGTAEPGATVQLHALAGGAGPVVGSSVVAADGSFSVSPLRPVLGDTTLSFSVVAVDPAGNSSSASNSVTYFSTLKVPAFVQSGPVGGTLTIGLALARLDGNGTLDIAAGNGGGLQVLKGNGAGGFGSAASFAGAGSGQFIAVGDLNRDGRSDLVVVQQSAGNVQVFLSNGDGTFAARPPVLVGGGPNQPVLADVNLDGILDVVVPCPGINSVAILLGDGSGNFVTPGPLPVASLNGPTAVSVGDLNGDGMPDLIIASTTPPSIQVQLGNGDGTFTVAPVQSLFTAGSTPTAAFLADLDGDGILDSIIVFQAGFMVTQLGNGNGTFKPLIFSPHISSPFYTAMGDLNGDGRLDIVSTSVGTLRFGLGKGDGSFVEIPSTFISVNALGVAIGDVNGDGRPDLVTSTSAGFETFIEP